jgi:hypothetical protein|tara:strand:+ start:6518 stop:6934 length:417 start_codon:yes stop_codon:yes gene_type:complete
MSQNKTNPTNKSVDVFLDELENSQQRQDSQVLIDMMRDISGEQPVMWGSSIIGFGTVRYKYASGREGEWMRIGFSPRKNKLSLYMTPDAKKYQKQLDELGNCEIGKGCVYIKKLDDVDQDKLRDLIQTAYDNDDWKTL